MLQSEFEERTNKRVNPDEYAMIERVSMAAPDSWDKNNFCKAYDEYWEFMVDEVREGHPRPRINFWHWFELGAKPENLREGEI